MELNDLLGRDMTLNLITTTYRSSAEHLCFTFCDPKTGEKVQVSISAERGSDLFVKVRNKKKKSKAIIFKSDGK